MRKLLWLARPAIEALSAHVSVTGAIYWPIINILKIIEVDLYRLAESIPEANKASWARSVEEVIWADFIECLNYRENHRYSADENSKIEDWFLRVEKAMKN